MKWILLILVLSLTPVVSAHSGRTDSSGCHNCYTDECYGEYHCHNGGYYESTPDLYRYKGQWYTLDDYTRLILRDLNNRTPTPTATPTPTNTPTPTPNLVSRTGTFIANWWAWLFFGYFIGAGFLMDFFQSRKK